MLRNRPALFKGRHFEADVIILCVRWYLRFGLSFRNLEEMMAERNLTVDHVTICQGVNKLPKWARNYIHEVSTFIGAEEVRELTFLRDQNKALIKLVGELTLAICPV
jgi:hypothetical protein